MRGTIRAGRRFMRTGWEHIMRTTIACIASLILAAYAAPAACQPKVPAMQSNTTTPFNTTSTANGVELTMEQARDRIREAGYRHVHALMRDADGVWHAKATKDGQARDVSVDLMGSVSTG
jgi:hypothetical protein